MGDACPSTLLPDVPTLGVKKNRYAADASGVFGDSGYTLADTAGCSGGQIIDRAALGKGHTKFGITRGALEDWIAAL